MAIPARGSLPLSFFLTFKKQGHIFGIPEDKLYRRFDDAF
jgi:hypothetical protein